MSDELTGRRQRRTFALLAFAWRPTDESLARDYATRLNMRIEAADGKRANNEQETTTEKKKHQIHTRTLTHTDTNTRIAQNDGALRGSSRDGDCDAFVSVFVRAYIHVCV